MLSENTFGNLKMYEVIGRKVAKTTKDAKKTDRLFRMTVFAKNSVCAKSKFWSNITRLEKVKKTHGEIVSIKRVLEADDSQVKNVGIVLRYDSRHRTHTMYCEYRDTSIVSAVNRCYHDMAGKHRAKADTLHIIKANVIEPGHCHKSHVTQFHDKEIKYPLPHRVVGAHKKSVFSHTRPNTFF